MTKRTKGWIIGGSIGFVILVAAALSLVFLLPKSGRFRLDEEYYGSFGKTFIDDKEYEQMIADKKSCVVMVDQPGCLKTDSFDQWLEDYPEEMHFKYFGLRWSYAKETSLYNYVKYTPSIALIHEGEVVAWLDADSDEDKEYYDNAEALKGWLEKYLLF